MTMNRAWIAIVASALCAGCGLLPKTSHGCDKPQPYQSAREAEPLRTPPGVDAPDTRNALRIPSLPPPRQPAESGRCLDYPPAYEASRLKKGG